MSIARHVILAAGLLAVGSLVAAGEAHEHGGQEHAPATSQGPSGGVQTSCPVMAGNAIDPSIFSVYKGKKVYFCCQRCKAAFDKAPEKYVGRLPQFAGTEALEGAEHAHGGGITAASLIEPLGITTLTLLLLTAGAGLLRRKSPRLLLKLHKALALLTVLAGLSHATLVFLVH